MPPGGLIPPGGDGGPPAVVEPMACDVFFQSINFTFEYSKLYLIFSQKLTTNDTTSKTNKNDDLFILSVLDKQCLN